MSKKSKSYGCNLCGYKTSRKYDLKIHKLSKKHITLSNKIQKTTENRSIFRNYENSRSKKLDRNIKSVTCDYCGTTISAKKNLTRHYTVCFQKKIFDKLKDKSTNVGENNDQNNLVNHMFVLTMQAMSKKDDITVKFMEFMKEKDLEIKELKEEMKIMRESRKSKNTIEYDSYRRINTKYVRKNFTNVDNYMDIMDKPLTADEQKIIRNLEPIDACIALINSRCIEDVDPDKRCLHCSDDSRNKFIVYMNGEWKIDKKGKNMLDPVFDKIEPVYWKMHDEFKQKLDIKEKIKSAKRQGLPVSEEDLEKIKNLSCDTMINHAIMKQLGILRKDESCSSILKKIGSKILLSNVGVKNGKCIVYGRDTKQIQ